MRKRILIALALLGLLGAGLWILIRRSDVQAFQLPDGTTLRFMGASYGKQHRVLGHGPRWWENFLPAHEIARFDSEADTLALYLKVTRPPASKTAMPSSRLPWNSPDWWDRAEILDETGHAIAPPEPPFANLDSSGGLIERQYGPPGSNLQCLLLRNFPRRGKKVIVQFYRNGQKAPIARFTLPNPSIANYPRWQPEPLPIAKRNGARAFTLTSLTTGAYSLVISGANAYTYQPHPLKNSSPSGAIPLTQAAFQVTEQGRPVTYWQPVSLSLTDATGNRQDLSSLVIRAQDIEFFPSPCSGETVKLAVTFRRTQDAFFLPEEQWTVSGLKVPQQNTVIPSIASRIWGDMKLEILGLAGAGTVRYPRSKGESPTTLQADLPSVRIRLSPRQIGDHILVRGQDEQGRPVTGVLYPGEKPHPWIDSVEGDNAGNTTLTVYNSQSHNVTLLGSDDLDRTEETFFLKIPPGAKSLSLTFALSRPLTCEYLVTLPTWSPN